MAGGLPPGPERGADGRPLDAFRPLSGYLDEIRAITDQGIVDVMLVSSSSLERLGKEIFERIAGHPRHSAPTTRRTSGACGEAATRSEPSRPFRTASLSRARELGCDLCLYSITLQQPHRRRPAESRGVRGLPRGRRAPAACATSWRCSTPTSTQDLASSLEETGAYVGDCIIRCLAGLTRAERPSFLKIAYNGPRAMTELCSYDPELVVGILGGAAGTNRDTLPAPCATPSGTARCVALFGRKIKLAESPLEMVRHMRKVVDGELSPEEAVHAYHAAIRADGLVPARSLDEDLRITEPALLPGA